MNFKELSQQLRELSPNTNETFKCPFCLKSFYEIDPNDKKIAKAHVIPEALGGKYKTFACKTCDNELGGQLEGHIINFIRDMKILAGKMDGSIRGKTSIELNGHSVVVQPIYIDAEEYIFKIPNPFDANYFSDYVNAQNKSFKFDMILEEKGLEIENIERFYLKMAYLAAFDRWGYHYILKEEVDKIRRFLMGEIESKPYHFGRMITSKIIDERIKIKQYLLVEIENEFYKYPLFISDYSVILLPPLDNKKNKPFNGYNLEENTNLQIKFIPRDNNICEIEVFFE